MAGPGCGGGSASGQERVSGSRSDRTWSRSPVSAQMLGETDADEALDCDEGPDEDDV